MRATREEQLDRDRINLRKRVENSPKYAITRSLRATSSRCKLNGVSFKITADDFNEFPSHCPDLNIELVYGNKGKAGPNSATVDRIQPDLGYVPGNVRIISRKANAMKQDASFEEMLTIAESWMRLYKQSAFTKEQTDTQTVLNGVNNDVQK